MTISIPDLEFISPLGEGGMASVWKAWDARRGQYVAVKILRNEFAADGAEVRAFRTEARTMEEIRHPGIVSAYDFDCANGVWYFIMEYVDGYSFSDLLARKQHVREPDCLLICESIASALDSAWNGHGLIHCDIKPENIMINAEGVVKLTDLGISHKFNFARASSHEVPEHVRGTPAYISPEQVYGDVELDCRSDIYSLGATLYHLATGRVLFPNRDNDETMRAQCDETMQARDPRAYRPELSVGFCQLLEAMLVKNRDARLASWPDVYQMCRDVEAGVRFRPRDTREAASTIRLMVSGI